jgi:hypothetical protein
MQVVPNNYRGSPPRQRPPTQVANWDDWGRRRCDEVSVIGLMMVGGGHNYRKSQPCGSRYSTCYNSSVYQGDILTTQRTKVNSLSFRAYRS